MKHLFIVNPTAGGSDKSGAVRAQVESAFAVRAEPWEVYVTKAPLDAVEKIRLESESGGEMRVYACGGDGTFNECVNGAALRPNVAVCPFPTGTGNDFCRQFGDGAALFRDLDALLAGTVRPIDLIDCGGRYGVNICSVGIDARIGTGVHEFSRLPLVRGPFAYIVSSVVNMFRGIARPMRIRFGDTCIEGPITLACICNGQYYGGGFHPSLTARPDDGELDIFIAGKVTLPQFARLIGKYAKGQAAEMTGLVTHFQGTSLSIAFEQEDVVNLDGEAIYARELTMKLVPGALNLIVPKGLRWFER